ncbi:MAG: TetR/AcrR family transcriptional regulator [Novosphingobium sp.]|nr:TetR/AcrR family transcriptional regulator [Novosphingobium sp.]
MTDTKKSGKPRGRPRRFDPEEGVAIAQALFHACGYDAVGVAALTEALGINPPSFYAAYGSKAALFERAIERYARDALPMDAIFREGRDWVEAVADLFEVAARVYSADPAATGCLVLESARSESDPDCAGPARAKREESRATVRDFVALTASERAEAVADYAITVLSGLSASAREGWPVERLLGPARLAGSALG